MDTTAVEVSTQAYQLVVYGRALHPEAFDLRSRKTLAPDAYTAEAWLMPGGHVLRFGRSDRAGQEDGCVSELVTDREDDLPASGAANAFLCAGDREHSESFPAAGVNYLTSVQTETLSEALYDAIFREMLDHAAENESQRFEWSTPAGRNLSLLDVQGFHDQIHAQAYHLIARGGFVLRTQSIFELVH
ncbi:MAG: hypothetical protein AAGF47_10235 [Planctomycetota bacterium]